MPVLTHLEPLDKEALIRILTEPQNAITKQYQKLFELDNVKLTYDKNALEYIVDKAIEFKLGARGLRSLMETIMMEAMYETPSSQRKTLKVSKALAEKQLAGLNKTKLLAAE